MSKMPIDGVIKFKFNLKLTPALREELYIKVEKWRVILFKMNFIGEYKTEKVGYGNLSQRLKDSSDEFIITGTQTGSLAHLDGKSYTKVTKCDLAKMSVEAHGPIAPSSESLTHFGIYMNYPKIGAIFHVHHNELWNYMLKNSFDKTPSHIDYGTQEMADAAKVCIGKKSKGIFVMEGHKDGIVSYGATPEEAGRILLDTLKESKN